MGLLIAIDYYDYSLNWDGFGRGPTIWHVSHGLVHLTYGCGQDSTRVALQVKPDRWWTLPEWRS